MRPCATKRVGARNGGWRLAVFVVVAPLLGAAPQVAPAPAPPGSEPVAASVAPIDLATALRLAQTSNLDIAQAREVVAQAQAQLDRARVLLLPTLNLGSSYFKHEGNIAKTEGNIIKVNKDALFVGGGPALTVSYADAVFAPLVARQVSAATQAAQQRVTNDTILAVAEAYANLMRARRRLARVEATLDALTSDQASPARAGSKGLFPVVETIQKAGAETALKSEVERVRVEVLRRQEEKAAALQEFRVASAELARLLRLDPQMVLWPLEDFRVPLDVSGPWFDQPVEDLIRVGLVSRPELAENQALVQAALERAQAARWRPLLPNLIVSQSWGDFGGGPDKNGSSGRILHMNTRNDYDATLVWRLSNLGLGNRAELREQDALARQASLRQQQLLDRIVAQVVQAHDTLRGSRERFTTIRAALFDAKGEPNGPVFQSLRLNFERVRGVEKTRPLETLDSIRGLNDALETYGQAVTDVERARIRLLIALGLTPQEIIGRLAPEAAPRPGPNPAQP